MGRSIYTIEDLESELYFAPNAFVALDYLGAPTAIQLEQEIVADLHTNQFEEIGCPVCGNVDMFTREINTKGRRYRCGYCFYNSDTQFETVKSQKDITLSSFGLDYVCDICGESIDSYNQGTVIRHMKKHEDENKVLEAEEDSLIVYRRMSWEQYFDALDRGYLMPTQMRHEIDGFISKRAWSISDKFNTSTTPLFDSPLDHLKEGVLPMFEIALLPSDDYQDSGFGIIDVFSAIPVERVTQFSTSEDVLVYDTEERFDMVEFNQQDPDHPDRMWSSDIISPIFPYQGHERPVEEVRAQLHSHLVGQQIRMWGPQTEAEAVSANQNMEWWKDVGFSEHQPPGTFGKVTGVSQSNPNRPNLIGVWVTIISGGSEAHPVGTRVWFHVKDSNFPRSLGLGWEKGDYMAEEITDSKIRQWLKVLRDSDPDWEEIDWEKTTDKPVPDWDEIEWDAETYTRQCDICSRPAHYDEDLCSSCWTEYLTATYANKHWTEHQHQEVIGILNWITAPINAERTKEPIRCPQCDDADVDLADSDIEIGSITREYRCNHCVGKWEETWHFHDYIITQVGQKP